jgi:GH35 family endo-1,4-beta-xylanase
MMTNRLLITIIMLLGFTVQPFTAVAAPDSNFHIYLLFGQSNMEGVAAPSEQDYQTNPRVMVMQDETCSGVGRYGQWRLASPPLIRCVGKLGPGDYFGKTLADNTNPEITIGLVGAAYQGQSINFFLKDCAQRGTCNPANGNGSVPEGHNGGYAWLLDLAQRAQQDGVIKGIIMHQGESDTGQQDWLDRVNAVVTDLRNDLGIGDVPFIAGEMVPGACCTAHNPIVQQIPQVVSNGHFVSADGLAAMDAYHFNAEGYREMGRRYAEKMLTLIDTTADENEDENDTDVVAAINAGSDQGDTYDDVYYDSDNYYNGGTTHSTGDSITNASNTSIYQSERYGSYAYEIPVNNGDYRVELGMVEMYWKQAGSRSFSVAIEGESVLGNLDIHQTVGHDTAYNRGPFNTVVDDGSLTIQVNTSVDNGTLSRILVLAGHADNPDSGDSDNSDTDNSDPGDDDTNNNTDAKFVGNITHSGSIPSDFANYWDQITCENKGKWASMEPSRDNMNWSGVDTAYNYAKQHGMPYKHHTFVWGQQYPIWMNNLSQSEQIQEVAELIQLYCERYPDTEMIDVVNEPDHATPSWASALGGAGSTGHDWVIWAFEKARQYCPDATLILNDYNVLRWDTDNFVSIANKLKQRGLLDAVGCQAHGLESQSFSELQSNFNKVAGIGVPIYISEYDINLSDDNQQLQVMQQQFPLFYESPQVAGITFWGYIYGQTWRSNTGLVRNEQFRPAMSWLMNYLGR